MVEEDPKNKHMEILSKSQLETLEPRDLRRYKTRLMLHEILED